MMDVEVTEHAKKRIKERMGLSKDSTYKIAQKALQKGITHIETKGSLHRYLDMLFLQYRNANNLRIYAEKVFIFNNDRLITVFDLPNHYKKYANELKKAS